MTSLPGTTDRNPDVLSEDVTVSAGVPLSPTIIVKPENRIPPTGNDSLSMDIEVRDGTTTLTTESVITDSTGTAPLAMKTVEVVSVGEHDIAIKGLSHLRKVFKDVQFGPANTFTLDLTPPPGT